MTLGAASPGQDWPAFLSRDDYSYRRPGQQVEGAGSDRTPDCSPMLSRRTAFCRLPPTELLTMNNSIRSEIFQKQPYLSPNTRVLDPLVQVASIMRSFVLVGVLALWNAFLSCGATNQPATRQVPPGFVTTNGRQFELDGKPFASLQLAGSLCISDRCRRTRHSSGRIPTWV